MAVPVMMPKQGQSVESCIISQWFKKKGDSVKAGDILFSYETDKASFEEEAKADGILLDVFYGEGDEVPVLNVVAIIGHAGESIDEYRTSSTKPGRKKKAQAVETPPVVAATEELPETKRRGRRPRIKPEAVPVIVTKVRVAPPVRELAKKLEVDLHTINGTGNNGSITLLDVQMAAGMVEKPVEIAQSEDTPTPATTENVVNLRVSPPVRTLAKSLGIDLLTIKGSGIKGSIMKQDVEKAAGISSPVVEPVLKIRVTPPVRMLAEKLGVDIYKIEGSGTKGSITKHDVEQAAGIASDLSTQPKMRISPRAIAMAQNKGIDISTIKGSGPGGRILTRDIAEATPGTVTREAAPAKEAKTPKAAKAPVATPTPKAVAPTPKVAATPIQVGSDFEVKALSNVRKLIAGAMYESLQNSAQLTHHMSADVRKLLTYREEIKNARKADATYPNITINDMICWSVVRALEKYPEANSQFTGNGIKTFKKVHLGLAVDTPRGLMVPVLKNADDLSLKGLSYKLFALAEDCRKGNIDPDLLQSAEGSFTVSNLGSYGVEMFTPIVNVPQVAILGVNTIVQRPVDIGGGIIAFVPHIGLSLTYDHRAIDGGPATLFLKEIKMQIENLEYNA